MNNWMERIDDADMTRTGTYSYNNKAHKYAHIVRVRACTSIEQLAEQRLAFVPVTRWLESFNKFKTY